jgi:RimJ/RimL family protein N-acetyltransferase
MKNDKKYLFTSERLGFRNWNLSDIDKMHEINSDEEVMEFFPGLLTKEETSEFVMRMKSEFEKKGFCYFAVEKIENNEFIGFTGLSEKTYEADFTPCIDIGWRIKKSEWNKGFATESAKRCLEYGLNELRIDSIYSVAPKINTRSERVMIKAGMKKLYEFEHSLLLNNDRLRTCVLYKTERK